MGDKTRELLKAKRRHGWYLAVMLVLAVLVTVGVGGLFHQPAVAKTYQVTALTCTAEAPVGPGYAGYFVHKHNEDCFNGNGNLVCPLPEIKAHVHDETCYTTTAVQTCGLAESDGHQHTEACYTRVQGDLICKQSTEPVLDEAGNVLAEGHVHTDECFAWTEELTCGMEEGEGAHHHNDSCFEYVTSLSCGMPEVILHTHTDDCYQKNEDGSIYVDEDGNTLLICGLPEVTEHVHGPECFTVYELDDEEAGNTENTEGEESGLIFLFPEEDASEEEEQPAENQETDPEASEGTGETNGTPDNTSENTAENTELTDGTDPNAEGENQEAASGEEAPIAEEPHTVVYTGTRGAEKGGVTVLAEIPEGALDESAQLFLGDTDESAARNLILQVVNANAAEGEEREISSMLLMDIGFVSGGEPAVLNGLDPIRVTIKAAAIRSMSVPKLFHLSGGTAQEVKDVLFDAEAGTTVFTAATFSPFAIVDLTGEEAAEEAVSASMPAQSFTGETESVIVSVEAPEGAFPEGTTMVVSPVEMDDDTLNNVTGAVESSGEKKVVTAQAVDISFFDAGGSLIEPKLPIKVSMKSALVSESENVALVHLAETGATETAETETPEAPAATTAEVVTDVQVVENPDENNEIQFESDAFSIYVLVETETITTNYITADGETYSITVTYGPEAMIPAGATLAVAEIPQNSEEYAAYLAQAQAAVKAGSNAGSAAASAESAEATEEAAEAVEEAPASAVDAENTESAIGTTDRVTVTTARFFDITILDAEGNPVEPAAPVDVKIEYMEPAETAENYQVVHFGEETEVLNPAVSGADGAASTFDFQTNSFSIFGVVGTKIIEADVLLSDGNLYTVSVTYDEDAHIPSGSSLMVVPFEEGTPEYEYARNSVLADKKARGEWVDLSNFGLAALDISILNPNGEEIEPEAPVQVEIRIKELPGVENLNEVVGTLAIQHHVEVEDGVVVETVFNGNAAAAFRMETNETVAVEGTVVDPNSVSEEDFVEPETSLPYLGEDADYDDIDVSFEAPVFSTFTITWNDSNVSNSTTNLRWRTGGWQSTVRAQMTVHYVDTNGNPISRPSGIDNNYNINNMGNGNFNNTVAINASTLARNIPGYTYQNAYTTVNSEKQTVTSVNATRSGPYYYYYTEYYTNAVTYYNNGTNVRTESGYWDEFNAGDLYLVYSSETSDPHTTIHYGYMDGNNFVEFDEQPSPVQVTTSNTAYLIYDFDGYQYEGHTYYRTSEAANGTNMTSGSTEIEARLRYSNNAWQYRTGGSWGNVTDGSHIYVTYEKKPDAAQGGTPTVKQSAQVTPPEDPTITKTSTVNEDGTNTLALSVSGHTTELEVEKLADVIVVFDISGSMSTSDMSGDARIKAGRDAINSLAHVLLNKTNSYDDKLIRMGLVTFSTDAQVVQELTDDEEVFKTAVDGQTTASGGTNWEKALMLANQMEVDSGRATFVIFVTDGDPTFRISRMNETDDTLDLFGKGTGGSANSYYVSNNVFGEGNDDSKKNNYNAAKVEAESIIAHKKTLYTIAISSDASHLDSFADDVGAAGKYTATSTTQLTEAFNDIASSIIALMGHSDIQISDGITALTQTVQKSSLVNFAEDDFIYYKKHDYDIATQKDVDEHRANAVGEKILVNGDWETWDPTSEGCAEAVYNTATGAVEWNMGEGFMLEEGYTYQVRFKVWPSQDAYDLLADLNNGKKSYDSLTDAEKAQISEPETEGGMYTLKTNSETSYTYREATKSGDTVTPTGEPSEPGSFPDVDPLELTTKPLKVKKQWHNNYVDSRTLTDSITMELYGVDSDGTTSHNFKTFTLTKDGGWYAENNYISYGLVTFDTTTNAGAKIYETGHDFTLRETDDEAHYYELTAGVFRPMFINGTPTILEKVDAAPAGMSDSVFHYSDGSHHYYRLDGKIYRDTLSDILLIATNSHRSYMDLNKVVVDESGAAAVDDTEFEYEITFTVPSGIDNYDTLEQYIWFSVYDSAAGRTLAPSEYTCTGVITPADENPAFSGDEYANYLVAISGQPMTLKIKQGWNVRFLNLPVGTTYSFKETSIPEGYSFVKAEVSGTRWIANMVDGTDQGSAQTMSPLPANTSGDNSDTAINGTIDFANARYKTTYTNKTRTQQVIILKTNQDGKTPLPGAEFSLYTKSGYEATPQQTVKTSLTSDANGIIYQGPLAYGTYYLVETKAPDGYNMLTNPVQIVVSSNGITSQQSDYRGNQPINYSSLRNFLTTV